MWSGRSCPLALAYRKQSGQECPLHIETLWRHNYGRARENFNSEGSPQVETARTRGHVVRGTDDLLTQLRRQGWTVLHGLFNGCGYRIPVSDP
jgi:hypothetical protein